MSRLTVWLHKLGPSMTPCNFELGPLVLDWESWFFTIQFPGLTITICNKITAWPSPQPPAWGIYQLITQVFALPVDSGIVSIYLCSWVPIESSYFFSKYTCWISWVIASEQCCPMDNLYPADNTIMVFVILMPWIVI